MHLTQQQQLNHQMCPPPLGPPTAWFINHPQQSSLPPPPSSPYHSPYHQNYYNGVGGGNGGPGSSLGFQNSNLHNAITSSNASTNNTHQSQSQNHLHQHHHAQPPSQQQQQQQYSYSYHHHQPQIAQQQQQQQQQHQSSHHNQQQYNNQLHQQQQPLTIQQPQSQHVHQHQHPQQQQSPRVHQQQGQPQLSPHPNHQPRPSPTLHQHQHQQSSPNYQQHSPLNQQLTSPSLQPSPVLHHQPTPQPQHSPLSRHQQQPTPPHHTPTPTSQTQNLRPASVTTSTKETAHYPSNILQTEVRVLELNRRLQCRPSASCYRNNPLPTYDQYDDFNWWEEFINDFFKEDATLTLFMQVDDKPVKYFLRRTLISRFFKSYFDGGVTELSINLRNSKELRGHHMVVLDCDYANIITKNILKHPKVNSAPRVVVCTEGHLSLEFVGNSPETLLIKSWKFKINLCHEYIDRSITALGLPNTLLVEPTTFQGLPNSTMLYLKMCSIMEPMQVLMSEHKMTNLEPRACLKKLLYERYRFKSDDDINKTSATKRRRRKAPNSPATGSTVIKRTKSSNVSNNNNNSPVTRVSPPAVSCMPPLNILVVGESSNMAVEYRDDNERIVTKVENSNYVPAVIETTQPNNNNNKSIPSNQQIDKQGEDEENININEQLQPQQQIEIEEKGEVTEEKLEEKEEVEEIKQVDIILDDDSKPKQELLQQFQADVKVEPAENDHQLILEIQNNEEKPPASVSIASEEQPKQLLEEPVEKENNNVTFNDDTHTNSTATQSENHYNIMNSIPEDREDTCRSTSCDSIVSKLPPSSNNKNTLTSNGSSNKQNRRRSSERKETLREGLMRTSDFVVAMKDLKSEHPALWRITTGNNLLQQFEPKIQNGSVLYENTNQYAGWNPEIKKDYVGVDVKLTQHTRNQITVERLLLNFQKLEEADTFYDKHFVIYLQILISTTLDPKFWESIESEPKHHDYFLTSRRIIEDITKRFKIKLAGKLKLGETSLKNVEKYPNLLIKPVDKEDKEQLCRACNTKLSTQIVTFGNRSYDLHSYKPVKVTSELSKTDDKDLQNSLCDTCLEIVKLYSEIHHMGWKLFNLAKEKVELHRSKGKPLNAILDECLKDEDWLASIYGERDALWAKVEHIP